MAGMRSAASYRAKPTPSTTSGNATGEPNDSLTSADPAEVWRELASEINETHDMKRLSALLHHGELMCCTTAVHRGADNERWRPVWIGVGRLASHGDLTVFIFSRSLAKFAARCWEGLYCVLPIVSNIQVDAGNGRLIFYWSARAHARRLRHRTVNRGTYNENDKPLLGFIPTADRVQTKFECMGDLHLEGIPEGSRVCDLLMECHQRACILGLTFHSEQRANHKELLTLYRDFLPMDLAELRSAEMVVPSGLQEPARNSRVKGLVLRPTLKKTIGGTGASSSNRDPVIKLMCITWNVGATGPNPEASLASLLVEAPDAGIICIGLQEVCKLNARRIVQDGNEWLAWKEWAENGVKETFGDKMEYLHHSHLVGLLAIIFVRSDLLEDVSGVRACKIATGVGGYGGNKGAACIRFDVGECSMCFVNCHLAAGQEKYIERCADFQSIFERISFAQEALPDDETSVRSPQSSIMRGAHRNSNMKDIAGGNTGRPGRPLARNSSPMINMDAKRRMTRSFNVQDSESTPAYTVHDHHHVIWLGDTNSRIHSPGNIGGVPLEEAVTLLKDYKSRLGELRQNDQLNMMKAEGLAFVGFEEQDILFLPSYKWWPNKDMFDIRSQKHIPAWTDRVLWRSMVRSGLKPLKYDMHFQLKQSDHRPVYAIFSIGGDDADFMRQGGLLAEGGTMSSSPTSNRSFPSVTLDFPPGMARKPSRRRSSFMSSTSSGRNSAFGEWRMSYSDSFAFQEAVVRAVRNFLPPAAQQQQQQQQPRTPPREDTHEWGLDECSEESDEEETAPSHPK